MDYMAINSRYYFTQEYLPTKKHKTTRIRTLEGTAEIKIRKPETKEFPLVATVHDAAMVYDGAKTYLDIQNAEGDYQYYDEDIRCLDGKFYKARRVTFGAGISSEFETIDRAAEEFRIEAERSRYESYDSRRYEERGYTEKDGFSEESVIVRDNSKSVLGLLKSKAENMIIFENKIWEECGEPVYEVRRNGGYGSYLSITYTDFYNVYDEYKFRADRYEEAMEAAGQPLKNEKDTGLVKETPHILVHLPGYLSDDSVPVKISITKEITAEKTLNLTQGDYRKLISEKSDIPGVIAKEVKTGNVPVVESWGYKVMYPEDGHDRPIMEAELATP